MYFLKLLILVAFFLTNLPTSLTELAILLGVDLMVLKGLRIVFSTSSSNTYNLSKRELNVLSNIGMIIIVNNKVRNRNKDIIVPIPITSLDISSEHLHFSLVKYLTYSKA